MLITHTLIKANSEEKGPSKTSTKLWDNELSRIPRSFENLFIRTPEGVRSKKCPGLLTIPKIMSSWIFSLEFKIQRFKK